MVKLLLRLRQDICVHSAHTDNVISINPLLRLRITVYCASDYVTYYGMSHWGNPQYGLILCLSTVWQRGNIALSAHLGSSLIQHHHDGFWIECVTTFIEKPVILRQNL